MKHPIAKAIAEDLAARHTAQLTEDLKNIGLKTFGIDTIINFAPALKHAIYIYLINTHTQPELIEAGKVLSHQNKEVL